jgi:predicted ATPase
MSLSRLWHYFDDAAGQWVMEPITLLELEALKAAGKISEETLVVNAQVARRSPKATGMPYSRIVRPRVTVTPSPEDFWARRMSASTTVLCGPNNCGKTFMLKQLYMEAGHGSYLLGTNRFSHVGVINTRLTDQAEYRQHYENFQNSFYLTEENKEENSRNLEQILTGLDDAQLDKLFAACKDLLGNTFSIRQVSLNNRFSPFYIDMDGERLAVGSSGTRLLLTLLGILFDSRYTTVLIDEPELGLSPRIQVALARLLFDSSQRKARLAHLKSVFIATHSHLLLDRAAFSNNYIVTKRANNIVVNRVSSASEFNHLQFNLLGNELEALFLPSSIVLVEGESDATFLGQVFQLHLPERKVALVRGGGDGDAQRKLNVLSDAFGDIATSPFRARTFVLLDKKNSVRMDRIVKLGILRENISVLAHNGIEQYYPKELVAVAFRCTTSEVERVDLEVDPIEFNGIRRTKKELADWISPQITLETKLDPELDLFLERVRRACA